MQPCHVPSLSPRYWAALCFASVLGANLGDLSSHLYHLGHAGGLPVLAILFGALLLIERRVQRPTEAFYWLAIVTLRTAATKTGDLVTHDLAVPYPVAIAVMAALMLCVVLAARRTSASPDSGMPPTTLPFWLAMFLAATLGTALGDFVSGELGLGTFVGSVVLCAITAVLLMLRAVPAWSTLLTYWLAVVAIRTAGTTLGDYLAFRHGLDLGLPASSALTCIGLIAVLVGWPRRAVFGRQAKEEVLF